MNYRILLYIFVIAMAVNIPAMGQQAVSAAGNHHSLGTVQLSWTLGELSISTYENTNNILTEGMQQSGLPVIASDDVITSIEDAAHLGISLFPNPATDIVHIEIREPALFQNTYMLANVQGTVVNQGAISYQGFSINVSQLAQGFYILKLPGKSGKVYTFKFLKK